MNRKLFYLLRVALLHLLFFFVQFAYAQVTVTEDFDYGTSAGSLTGQNGGTGFSAGWTGGSNAYSPTSLSFGTMTSVGGAMRVGSGTSAVRSLTKKFAPSGPISGSFLFQVSSVSTGSVLMLGLGDGGAANNQGYAIGLLPANDGQSGKPAVATKGAASMGALTAGAALSANTTYMYSFSYANGSTTAWILTPEQYDTFNSGGTLDQTAMNSATIGTGATNIVGRATSARTGDLPSRIIELYSYYFGAGTMLVDQISITGVPTQEAAITGQTGGAAFVFNNEPSTVGYEFSINQPITVSTLGFYDQNSDGLATAHPVGIFDLCGNLLMSGTVTTGTGAALTNGYRYIQITPAVLGAGSYRIGAVVFNGGGNDAFLHNVTTIVNDPIITYTKGVLRNGSTTLRYPSDIATSTGLSEKCCLGPNFQFVAGGTPPGTPDINLQGKGLDIPDGTTAVATTTGTDFGTVALNTPVSQTFTIQNVGTGDLIISSTSLAGLNQSEFAIAGIPLPTTITPGNSTTFTVRFTPIISGTLSATINIASNDCDETPYDFAVRGMADPASVGGTVAGSKTVCSGTNSTTLTLSGQTGAVQRWESSATADFATSTTISNTSTSLVVTDLATTTYYRAVVKNGTNLEANSSSATLVVNNTPSLTLTTTPGLTITTGQTATLTVSGANSFSWSSGESTTAISAGTTGTYTVTGTSGICSATISATLTVIPSLTVSVASDVSAICAGSSVALSVVASGGTSPYTYSWMAPTGITLSSTNNSQTTAQIGAGLVGPQTFTVTVTDNSNSFNGLSALVSTATISITVNGKPSASIYALPSMTVCEGHSLTLTGNYATPAPPPPGPSPAPAPSPALAPAPLPAPGPDPNSLRAGARMAAPLAIPNYTWSTGEFTQTIVLTPTSSSVISLTAYDGFCYADPVSVSITVTETPPSLTITATPGLALLSGQSTTLTASGATSYTWSANAGGIESASVVVNTAVTYSVTGTIGGCSSTANAVVSLTTSGNPGAALAFDGVDDLVSATGLLGTPPAEFTVEFWLNPSALSDYNQEISIGSTDNGAWNGFTFHSTGGGAVYVGTDIGSRMTPGEIPNGTVTLNTWQHFAYTFKSGIGKFYKNGVLLSTKEHSAPASFQMLRLAYGCCHPLNGLLDELRVWTVARNCDEINQQRNCELTGSESNLLVYYNFNQGNAGGNNAGLTTVIDAAGGDHNGIATGFSLTGTTSNWVAPGAVVSGSSCAAVVYPEINLMANSLTLVDGQTIIATADNTDFGSLSINGSLSLTYTIQNTGSSNLIIASITRSGSGSAAFAVSGIPQPTTLAGGSSTTFAVAFTPTTAGTFNAVIHVNSNDCDEGDFDVAVQGVADPNSVGGSVLGSTSVCTSTNSTVLSLTNQTGTVQKWQSALAPDFASPTDVASSTGLTSLTVTNLAQTTYYRAVVKSGLNPATNSSSATVVVNNPPTMVITPNPGLTITAGNSATLTASAANSYTWSASAGGVNSRSVVVSTDGVYSVTGTTDGCSATATVTVSVTQPTAPICNLTVEISPSAEAVCQDATLTLTAQLGLLDNRNSTPNPTGQARLAIPMLNYAWKAPAGAGLNSTSSEEVTASFTTSGVKTFTVIITDVNNCTAMNTVSVTVKELPTVTLVFPDVATVSPGTVITVPVGTGLTYQVLGGVQYNRMIVIDQVNGFQIRTVKDTTDGLFPIDRAGPYTITVTGANGCQRTVTGVIIAAPGR